MAGAPGWIWCWTMRVISFLLGIGLLSAQTAESVLDQGIEQFHKGEYATARKSFEKAVTLSPADARGITFLAITRAALGQCANSLEELRYQSYRNPDLEIRKLAGMAFLQCELPRNEFTEMMPVLAQLKKTFPNDADVIYEAAKVYNKAWNFSVYELYQKAPASFRVNQLSAEVFETQGRFGDAVSEYEKAIGKNPGVINLHYRLGRAILMQSHEPEALEKARVQFDAELKLNPYDAAAEYQVAQILQSQQKTAEAAEHLQKAIDLAPNFSEALVALGKLRLDAGEHKEAVSLLERAVQTQPGLEAAHYNLMVAYRDSGKKREAQREQKELEKLRKPPEGEFTEFLKKLGDKSTTHTP